MSETEQEVARAREWREKRLAPCTYSGLRDMYIKYDVDVLLAAYAVEPRWIKTSERPPEVKEVSDSGFSESEFVLILLADGGQDVAQYTTHLEPLPWSDGAYFDTREGRSYPLAEVTAWQPLPAALEGKAI